MKKYYKFGEIILALREEYKESKYLLDELNKCINIKSEYSNYYFTGLLSRDDQVKDLSDRKIRLYIEKKYLDILKKIEYLKGNWNIGALYSATFIADKKDNGQYGLKYNESRVPFDDRKYIPEIQIVNKEKFSELIDELFSTDLMQLERGYFTNNYDSISLDFDHANISTELGDTSYVGWNGINDYFYYIISKHNSPFLIEQILQLEIPADKISPDWLNLLEKHENLFDKEYYFDVDIKAQSKKGHLQISNIDKKNNINLVKLKKIKSKKNL
ncbi:MAG: hypothetical protein VZS44_05295 [Bacilli bacterium]|nr:hypothetical protein [Bacilli bacterium]